MYTAVYLRLVWLTEWCSRCNLLVLINISYFLGRGGGRRGHSPSSYSFQLFLKPKNSWYSSYEWNVILFITVCTVLQREQRPSSLPGSRAAEPRVVNSSVEAIGLPWAYLGWRVKRKWIPGKVGVARNPGVSISCEDHVGYKPGGEK